MSTQSTSMSLGMCPECGAVVSPRATQCPKCGHPLHSTAGLALAIISLVFGVLAFIIFAHAFGVAAIVCGAIAGAKGRRLGWVGMTLGIVALSIWAVLVVNMLGEQP